MTIPRNLSFLAQGASSTGVLGTANGGTNLTSFTVNGIPYASSSSVLTTSSAVTYDGFNFATTGNLLVGGAPITFGGTRVLEVYSNGTTRIESTSTGQYAVYNIGSGTSGTATNGYLITDATANILLLQTGSNTPLLFGTNGAERARVHASGGVSIGNTTDPGATNLSVTGTIDNYGYRQFGKVNGTTGVTLADASLAVVTANDALVGGATSTSYLIAKFTQNQTYRETAFWFQAFSSGDGGGLRTYVRVEGVMGASAVITTNVGATWGYETYNPASQLSVSVYKNTTTGTAEIWLNTGTYGGPTIYVDFSYMTANSAATVTWYGMQSPNPSATGKTNVAASFTTL